VLDCDNKNLNHKELLALYRTLPESIQTEVVSWGLNDTCVGDNIYEYLKKESKTV
jgi:hypothetical protein